ncbi:DUF2064 domain-containing protein [Chloroflexus sp.]|uniref:DUF2064 domain-containing protein n=1 Tax=Chloroflexus sp. TaxID=1904827 RepID=UPI002625DF27|nr:DUF2064 domain-containing protein [uncultured Chloroflexus sp.]
MQRTTLIFERANALRETFGIEAGWWSNAFLSDLQALVMRVTGATAQVTATAHIVAEMATEPVVIISGDTPHLPEARLRDTLTLLDLGADLVVGPCDRGSWYILGARQPALMAQLPLTPGELLPWLRRLQQRGLQVVQVPLWFRIMYPTDLAALAVALRTMPANHAPATRHLLGGDTGALAREWGA